jgi:hypothetical protein
MSAALEHLKWWLLKRRRRALHGADAWRYLSLSWRAPMREPEAEKVPIGISLPDKTFDQFMDLEDSWSTREERV